MVLYINDKIYLLRGERTRCEGHTLYGVQGTVRSVHRAAKVGEGAASTVFRYEYMY